jgi:hypothetical protein
VFQGHETEATWPWYRGRVSEWVEKARCLRRVLLSLLLDEGLLVTTLAGGSELGAGETTTGGVHALDAVTLLDLGHRGSLVAAVDTGGCGLLRYVSFVLRVDRKEL